MRSTSLPSSPRSILITVAIALLAGAAPRVAHASPGYPAAIKADLGLTYDLGTSHCTICHRDNRGGAMTVVQPFGVKLYGLGLRQERPDLLMSTLMTLETTQSDVDCDGTFDITQLRNGRDPNPPGEYIDGSGKMWTKPDPGCGDSVEFGCGARLARGPARWEGAAAILVGIGLAGARRMRRKRSRLSGR
jgi:hypothetical protein